MGKIVLVDKIGNNKTGTPFLDRIGHIFQCLFDIGLFIFRIEIDQFANNMQDMCSSLLRRNKFLDLIREENHPDLIVILDCRKSKHCSNFGNLVFLQFRNSPEITGGTDIDHQHDRQLPFFLEDLHIRTVAAGSHIPVDIPDIVAVLIFSYLTESHTSPLKGRMIFAGKNIFGQAPGFNLYLPDPL